MWAEPNVIWQAGKTISESLMKWRHAREQQLRWPLDPKSFSNGKQTSENCRLMASYAYAFKTVHKYTINNVNKLPKYTNKHVYK